MSLLFRVNKYFQDVDIRYYMVALSLGNKFFVKKTTSGC